MRGKDECFNDNLWPSEGWLCSGAGTVPGVVDLHWQHWATTQQRGLRGRCFILTVEYSTTKTWALHYGQQPRCQTVCDGAAGVGVAPGWQIAVLVIQIFFSEAEVISQVELDWNRLHYNEGSEEIPVWNQTSPIFSQTYLCLNLTKVSFHVKRH